MIFDHWKLDATMIACIRQSDNPKENTLTPSAGMDKIKKNAYVLKIIKTLYPMYGKKLDEAAIRDAFAMAEEVGFQHEPLRKMIDLAEREEERRKAAAQ